jgi:hypothetical protein
MRQNWEVNWDVQLCNISWRIGGCNGPELTGWRVNIGKRIGRCDNAELGVKRFGSGRGIGRGNDAELGGGTWQY